MNKCGGAPIRPSWLLGTCCFRGEWQLEVDGAFVRWCKQGTLQFVYIKVP